ncbi:Hypothetical Protein FCC1311_052652 [Hondaea fermentalgiana]|uniref:Uncharacterized protein n=1 Tax=Hondaea fermentalgiana TaxID=2315210 RepID=A0A2R5GK87_9STRA|nr:Hypothetical Protein FCC1311_052652 [Hondaea fermentalgiana]|eukprot:GBG29043.1 Hypothetical Protein FCC1311_052652 [Hondaea fermentalgiana]
MDAREVEALRASSAAVAAQLESARDSFAEMTRIAQASAAVMQRWKTALGAAVDAEARPELDAQLDDEAPVDTNSQIE